MCDIPIHCVIEALSDGCCMKCTLNGDDAKTQKLSDSYAIVAGRTPLSKLNDAVLTALGFAQFASNAAVAPTATLPLQNETAKTKGLIQIDNWKALSFDQITDDLETPIERLFKHIGGNRWTLKILVSSTAAKNNAHSSTGVIESTTGTTNMITGTSTTPDDSGKSSISDQDALASLTEASRLSWYSLLPRYHPYLSNYNAHVPKLDTLSSASIAAFMANRMLIPNTETAVARPPSVRISPTLSWPDGDLKSSPPGLRRQSSTESSTRSPKMDATPQRKSVLVAPRMTNVGGTTVGSRHAAPTTCRLMFDPLTELPMLNEWFENNSHPTCHDIEKYTETLNLKPYRRTYPPVSTHNVKIWFKNRRAKCKRI